MEQMKNKTGFTLLLDLDNDPAAFYALSEYARVIGDTDPKLEKELNIILCKSVSGDDNCIFCLEDKNWLEQYEKDTRSNRG